MKLSQLGQIHHVTGYVAYHVIIRFMTLQFISLLDASSNKRVVFEIMAVIKKKPPQPSEKLKKKLSVSIGKKLPKLDEKTRRKIGGFD